MGNQKNAQKSGRTRTKSSKTAKEKTSTENKQSSDKFVKDLLVRGEAAKPDKKGKLPQDATHVITKENPDGTVEVKRARFKMF